MHSFVGCVARSVRKPGGNEVPSVFHGFVVGPSWAVSSLGFAAHVFVFVASLDRALLFFAVLLFSLRRLALPLFAHRCSSWLVLCCSLRVSLRLFVVLALRFCAFLPDVWKTSCPNRPPKRFKFWHF